MAESASNTLVLVADDEPSTLALVASHVRSKGFNVIEASDGDQALQLAYENLPDLIILDVMMPGMSGWEVCRKVREAVSLAHTGVIMLTGIGENLNEMTSPLYGADSYIDKPFQFHELDVKIDDTLKQRREREQKGLARERDEGESDDDLTDEGWENDELAEDRTTDESSEDRANGSAILSYDSSPVASSEPEIEVEADPPTTRRKKSPRARKAPAANPRKKAKSTAGAGKAKKKTKKTAKKATAKAKAGSKKARKAAKKAKKAAKKGAATGRKASAKKAKKAAKKGKKAVARAPAKGKKKAAKGAKGRKKAAKKSAAAKKSRGASARKAAKKKKRGSKAGRSARARR